MNRKKKHFNLEILIRLAVNSLGIHIEISLHNHQRTLDLMNLS